MSKRTQVPKKSLVKDAQGAIAACAGWNSRLAARRITQFLDQRMAGSGLTIAQFGLLAQVAAASDDTLSALAERAGVDQSTLSRNLRGLEAAGLVEIAMTDKDLRCRAAWLTEQGARRLEQAIPVWRKAHAELARWLDPTLARQLGEAAQLLASAQPRQDSLRPALRQATDIGSSAGTN